MWPPCHLFSATPRSYLARLSGERPPSWVADGSKPPWVAQAVQRLQSSNFNGIKRCAAGSVTCIAIPWTPQVYFSTVRTPAEIGAKIAAGASPRASASGYSGKTLGLVGAKCLAGLSSKRQPGGAFLTVCCEACTVAHASYNRAASNQRSLGLTQATRTTCPRPGSRRRGLLGDTLEGYFGR